MDVVSHFTRKYSFGTVDCMNFIIFLCITYLKLFSLSFVPPLASNPGDATELWWQYQRRSLGLKVLVSRRLEDQDNKKVLVLILRQKSCSRHWGVVVKYENDTEIGTDKRVCIESDKKSVETKLNAEIKDE